MSKASKGGLDRPATSACTRARISRHCLFGSEICQANKSIPIGCPRFQRLLSVILSKAKDLRGAILTELSVTCPATTPAMS
jgi:hypothetical protein